MSEKGYEMTELDCVRCGLGLDVGRRKYCSNDCMNASRKRYPSVKQDYFYTRLHAIKSRAKNNGWDFNLTDSDLRRILEQPCVYCGTWRGYSQVDRKESLLGYTLDNVVPACKRCNTVKSMYLTYEQMIKVAEALGWRDYKNSSGVLTSWAK